MKNFWKAMMALTVSLTYYHIQKKQLDSKKQWRIDKKIMPLFSSTDNNFTLMQYRDALYIDGRWKYQYANMILDITKIKNIWFLIEPFHRRKSVGHTMLSFEFENGICVVLSVEARIPRGMQYNPLVGLLPKYEIMYVWGTERDLYWRRAGFLGHKLYMYKLNMDLIAMQTVFLQAVQNTNLLYQQSAGYNTLIRNCTSELLQIIRQVSHSKGSIRYPSIFTAISDIYLYKKKIITHHGSFMETKRNADITNRVKSIGQHENFSSLLRKGA